MKKVEEFIEMVVRGASPAAVVSEMMLMNEARTRAGEKLKEKNIMAKEFAKDARRAMRSTIPFLRGR